MFNYFKSRISSLGSIQENDVYPQNGALFFAPTTETAPLVTQAMRHRVLQWARLFFIFLFFIFYFFFYFFLGGGVDFQSYADWFVPCQ